MSKVNYKKVEQAFDAALQKLMIDNLSELATIAHMTQDPHTPSHAIEETIGRFQKELQKLKKQDPKLFERLNLSLDDEKRLHLPSNEFQLPDWVRLKELKERIDELKHELHGAEATSSELESQVTKERKKHINKRHNIRDGWLPLK